MNEFPISLFHDVLITKTVHVNRINSYDLVVTEGPILYEVKQSEILGFCDLSDSILKGTISTTNVFPTNSNVTISSDEPSSQIELDICFTYDKTKKNIFYLLKIEDNFVVLSKNYENNQIKCIKEFENVLKFNIEESNTDGECTINIQMTDGSFIQCNLMETARTNPVVSKDQLRTVHKAIEERISKVKAELLTTKLDIQAYFTDMANEVKFGSNNLRGDSVNEKVMLAKYGDIWIKMHNEMLVFGIPVYNCTYKRKRAIENIRVCVVCKEISQFDYTYNLYQYKIDSNVLPNFNELLISEDNFNIPTFDQEWTSNQNNILFPEAAAVIVITTNLMNFIDYPSYKFKCFVLFDIVHDSETYTLQNYCGSIIASTEVFYNECYQPTFEKSSVYKDFLTITATSSIIFIEISFADETTKQQFYDFLLKDLNFIQVNTSTVINDRMEINEEDDIHADFTKTSSSPCFDIFYQKCESHWKGTLLKITKYGNNVYKMKLYNRTTEKIFAFIQLINAKFHNKIDINPTDQNCKEITLRELKQAVMDETQALAKCLKSTSPDNSHQERFLKEFKTDVLCLSLK